MRRWLTAKHGAGAAACWLLLVAAPALCQQETSGRRVIDLNGTWRVAQGTLEQPPETFERTVPVPGLVDLAEPAFDQPGALSKGRGDPKDPPNDPRREAFWYRRTFTLEGAVPAVARLKVHKAKYGTRVYVNGQPVGDHQACFTPGYFNVRPHLHGEGRTNTLTVRVGAAPAALPESGLWGYDSEKRRYIPGIYDRVALICSGTPHVVNVQTAPDVEAGAVRVLAEVANAGEKPAETELSLRVRAAETDDTVGRAVTETASIDGGDTHTFERTVDIEEPKLWSPRSPFLYELTAATGRDMATARFGLRSFGLNPRTGRAVLNGEPYFLRGTNVCIFRFFEDPARGGKPWNETWVRKLFRKFKQMHWNTVRFCIGFPPDRWYEIADEMGLLIQDEYPMWLLGNWRSSIDTPALARRYRRWMRQRWNHPSVVIWDAQNETHDPHKVIYDAIRRVRGLDASDRPWDNGWGAPVAPGDVREAHPYFIRWPTNGPAGTLNRALRPLGDHDGVPHNGPRSGQTGKPFLINEYGWLWLHRGSGKPTRLSEPIYEDLLGPGPHSEAAYRRTNARLLAALTEFWRVRRQCAGVLHFCGLGHDRPRAYTSDNFISLDPLRFDPRFKEHVGDAFAPVAVMVDYWRKTLRATGAKRRIPVVMINDLGSPWRGTLRLQLRKRGAQSPVVRQRERTVRLPAYGKKTVRFSIAVPAAKGAYQLRAALSKVAGQTVRSLRDFAVRNVGLALRRPVTASSVKADPNDNHQSRFAVDANPATSWASASAGEQWLRVDLQDEHTIGRLDVQWGEPSAARYAIEASKDGDTWRRVAKVQRDNAEAGPVSFEPVRARYVKLRFTKSSGKRYRIKELRVFPRAE